jgi:hypothetical protein
LKFQILIKLWSKTTRNTFTSYNKLFLLEIELTRVKNLIIPCKKSFFNFFSKARNGTRNLSIPMDGVYAYQNYATYVKNWGEVPKKLLNFFNFGLTPIREKTVFSKTQHFFQNLNLLPLKQVKFRKKTAERMKSYSIFSKSIFPKSPNFAPPQLRNRGGNQSYFWNHVPKCTCKH